MMQRPDVRVPAAYPSAEDLSGKVIAVTGAGRGLGHVIADAMAAHGADVAVCARTQADLDKVAARVRARALTRPCDVRSVGDVRKFIETIAEMGCLDVPSEQRGRRHAHPLTI
jgi:NAD(P)-dependent dehydrogenase (short-subunit alcohol dehydrogenase family)